MNRNRLHFEPSSDEEHLLFVHQTEEQKRLIARYSGELCLVDATHRTKHAPLLFFIIVMTNVDYHDIDCRHIFIPYSSIVFDFKIVKKTCTKRT